MHTVVIVDIDYVKPMNRLVERPVVLSPWPHMPVSTIGWDLTHPTLTHRSTPSKPSEAYLPDFPPPSSNARDSAAIATVL